MTEELKLTVSVDLDELRRWADKLADANQHGVAAVLYEAHQRYSNGVGIGSRVIIGRRRPGPQNLGTVIAIENRYRVQLDSGGWAVFDPTQLTPVDGQHAEGTVHPGDEDADPHT